MDEHLPGEFLIDYVRTYYDGDFTKAPADGTYQIVNRHSGKVLDIPGAGAGNKAQLVQKDAQNAGAWKLEKQHDGTWIMVSSVSGYCADLTADAYVTSNGTSITQYQYHGGANQKWYLVPTEAGAFKIISALSGKSLCVKDASMEENAPVIQWTYGNDNSDTNDEWMFVPAK